MNLTWLDGAGIAKAIAAAAGKEAKIVHYDPAKIGLKKGEGFPFRCGIHLAPTPFL